jgi:hypothetical protein
LEAAKFNNKISHLKSLLNCTAASNIKNFLFIFEAAVQLNSLFKWLILSLNLLPQSAKMHTKLGCLLQ